jgi:lysylphosphatidylglycerol synthetase-like protein (DUF2156 family)
MASVTETKTSVGTGVVERAQEKVAAGAAAAAMVAGGIGTFVIGLMTTGAVISEGLKNALNLWNPAGPLSGKTTVGVLAWLVSWYLLNRAWHTEDRNLRQAFTITLVLIGLGLVLTFPPVFEAFE